MGTRRSRSFEVRHFTDDPAADGESDFIGPTAVLDTPGRIEFLRALATAARRFFGNERWDKPAVPPEQVKAALAAFKPQPEPEVRKRIRIAKWRWIGGRDGCDNSDALVRLRAEPGLAAAGDGVLRFVRAASADFAFPGQTWRFLVRMRLRRTAEAHEPLRVSVGSVLDVNLVGEAAASGSSEPIVVVPADDWCDLRIEVALDEACPCANVALDGERRLAAIPLPSGATVERLTVRGGPGWELADVWVQSYADTRHEHAQTPLSMTTVLAEDFFLNPSLSGWQYPDYDDGNWPEAEASFAHGGERYRGEDLYLRQSFRLPASGRVWLFCETLFPGGEIWVNGRVVHVQHDPKPIRIEITDFVRHDEDNQLAIRVFPFVVAHWIACGCSDLNSGWFAGRCWIDVTDTNHIEDLFVTTARLGPTPALRVRTTVTCGDWRPRDSHSRPDPDSRHRVRVRVRPWFPQEGPAAAESVHELRLEHFGRRLVCDIELPIPDGEPWAPGHPVLYRVDAILEDAEGRPLDDLVETTGLRTVDQEGGVFRLNGRPAMLTGGLLFGMRPPLEEQVRILRCAPMDHLVREVLLAKNLGANCIRMSVHESTYLGCNDPRLAELGDQLGICLLWTTTAWVRTASAWQLDPELLAADARLVRNRPSIVMWQPGNHPIFFDGGMEWWRDVFHTLLAVDDSRLICPVGCSEKIVPPSDDGTRLRDGAAVEPEPTWIHPLAARGNFEVPTGYEKGWEYLRQWPEPENWQEDRGRMDGDSRREYLESRTHAWFDFESEETIGQPNWDLLKGAPVYHLWSYEHGYDKASIGRLLDFDEWELSQAWQALSGIEAYRKKRLLDYDGMFWCTLDGGGNTGTYQKPLTDHLGHAKIAYYALRMVFQPTFAGSGNVDMSYGPGDTVPIRVIHLGPAARARVTASVRTPAGRELDRRSWDDIELPAGRSVVAVADWRPAATLRGMLILEYEVGVEELACPGSAEEYERTGAGRRKPGGCRQDRPTPVNGDFS